MPTGFAHAENFVGIVCHKRGYYATKLKLNFHLYLSVARRLLPSDRGMNGLLALPLLSLYENRLVGTLHLTNKIVFGGSAVHRSCGEKHERTLDVVPDVCIRGF